MKSAIRYTLYTVLIMTLPSIGCARVRVEAPKEPIKVDISMRLDIYQHVAKDIDDIESIVSGGGSQTIKGSQSFLRRVIGVAYAEDGLSPQVEQAAFRRRDRLAALNEWEQKGVLGENQSGLVEIRDKGAATADVEQLVSEENDDRMIIYQGISQKNGITVVEVQKIYAKKLQDNAAASTPLEVLNAQTGNYEWKVK
jgi:uncharacterized protein YdbL (DUF1318 family)